MLPCVPHLINIAQLGGLGRKEQRGIWRAGEAVFAHESEILSAFPAEPAPGLCQADGWEREGHAEVATGSSEAPLTQLGFPKPLPRMETLAGDGRAGARPRPRLRAGSVLGDCKHILKI